MACLIGYSSRLGNLTLLTDFFLIPLCLKYGIVGCPSRDVLIKRLQRFHILVYLPIIVGMNEHPDNKYIQSLRAGDYSLLSVIYEKEAAHIRQWVCQNQGSVADAQDVFQETIVVLYQKAADPDFVLTCPIGALLFSIARNKWLTILRQKKREDKVRLLEETRYKETADPQSLLEAVEEEAIQQQKLDETFRQLSETCQKLLQLLAKGLATADIVAEMGMTDPNTLYRRKNACIGRWQTLFKR